MKDFHILWTIPIILILWFHLFVAKIFIKDKKRLLTLQMMLLSLFIYSGLGIAFNEVNKSDILYFFVFAFVLVIFYILFTQSVIKFTISSNSPKSAPVAEDSEFWDSSFCKNTFIFFTILYLVLRTISALQSIDLSQGFQIVFDSSNNIKNLTGENSSLVGTIASIISPFYYIGLYFCFKKIRYIALVLVFDSFLTLLKTGYLSRHALVGKALICFFVFINGDINDKYTASTKKRRRALAALAIGIPCFFYIMVFLMEARLSSGKTFSISDFIYSEINYPKHYEAIHGMSPLVELKDFFLQLLDSFIPVLPTPAYELDLNVTFSERLLGYGLNSGYFSVKLPGMLGESFLIFGNEMYWVHAIVIAIMLAMVYKCSKKKPLAILFYYYLTCILKAGRAGYAELSQSILLNFLVLFVGINFIKLCWRSYVKQNR